MTRLRQRLTEDLELAGYSERTQEVYVRSVRQLAEHYGRSPDLLTEDEVRSYFVHIRDVKRSARSSITIALCGIKFFFEKTLQREWCVFEIARPPRQSRLPAVLTREEVQRVLAAVRNDTYRACLTTMDACGLRLSEGAFLRVADIDGARRTVHVVHGKGGRDRYVPLPHGLLEAGVNLRLIQAYLGHDSPKSTSVYTHLTREVHRTAEAPIDRLMQGL